MPNNLAFSHPPYLTTGNPLTENNRLNVNADGTASNTITYFGEPAGNLGQYYNFANAGRCQSVVLDSGATAATPQGVVAQGQVAFWKSRLKYIVTNNVAQAESAPGATVDNDVAGVFGTAVTAGQQCFVQQNCPGVNLPSTTAVAGQVLAIAVSGGVATWGTAAGSASLIPLGSWATAAGTPTTGRALAELTIPSIP